MGRALDKLMVDSATWETGVLYYSIHLEPPTEGVDFGEMFHLSGSTFWWETGGERSGKIKVSIPMCVREGT